MSREEFLMNLALLGFSLIDGTMMSYMSSVHPFNLIMYSDEPSVLVNTGGCNLQKVTFEQAINLIKGKNYGFKPA